MVGNSGKRVREYKGVDYLIIRLSDYLLIRSM